MPAELGNLRRFAPQDDALRALSRLSASFLLSRGLLLCRRLLLRPGRDLRLALAREVGAVRALIRLDVLELSGLVPDGVELLAGGAAMRGPSRHGFPPRSFVGVY